MQSVVLLAAVSALVFFGGCIPAISEVVPTQPVPVSTPQPTATPAPTATSAPTASPQPTATTIPTATPQPAPTLLPTVTPQPLPETASEYVEITFAEGIAGVHSTIVTRPMRCPLEYPVMWSVHATLMEYPDTDVAISVEQLDGSVIGVARDIGLPRGAEYTMKLVLRCRTENQ